MFSSPKSQKDFSTRNALLQVSLRPNVLPFQITDEYPIVLNPHNAKYSHCLFDDETIVAHANLWPRELVDENGNLVSKIGLVGNVATHENYRGRGLMRKLLTFLETKAILADLEALILWSDLTKFYQNLGFESLAQEWHCYFHPRTPSLKSDFKYVSTDDIKLDLIRELSPLKYKLPYTLKRDMDEFLDLLKIPNTYLFIYQPEYIIEGYFIVGKGFDMQGVIHEWGMKDIEALMKGISFAANILSYAEIVLLVPGNINKKVRKKIEKCSTKSEMVPMALYKALTSNKKVIEALSHTFIWGLDSI